MPSAGTSGTQRKTLAVKHNDGEPLTRADLQYDLLYCLFTDTRSVFTDPYTTIHGKPYGSKVTFRDLYINALIHSPRCSKTTKDKLLDNPAFGDEFGKISLLSNAGRINTTMAFFPEMRTALRTYHPVPSLQKTDGNLQDAPRIKNILKSCFLHRERQNPLMTPADVLTRSRSGEAPPTTIVNLIFILASHSAMIAQSHFGSQGPYDFLDFFCPVNVSSESRANAFLWLCFHYLEAPSPNPFDDDFSRSHPGKIPRLNVLSDEETALENVDPEDEKAWGEKMMAQRREFLLNKDKEPEAADSATNGNGEPPKDKPKPRGRGKSKTKAEAAAALLKPSKRGAKGDRDFYAERELGFPFVGSEGDHGEGTPSAVSHPPVSVTPLPSSPTLPPIMPPQFPSSSSPRRFTSPRPTSREIADPYPRRHRTPTTPMSQSTNGKAVRRRQRKPKDDKVLGSPLHHSAYPPAHEYRPSTNSRSRSFVRSDAAPYTVPPPVPRRSMLEQAWHVVNTTDPLRDSEDEEEADENTRHDLLLRLRIINRLRGREPTPEPEHVYVQPVGW